MFFNFEVKLKFGDNNAKSITIAQKKFLLKTGAKNCYKNEIILSFSLIILTKFSRFLKLELFLNPFPNIDAF